MLVTARIAIVSADLRAKLYELYSAFAEGRIDFVLSHFDDQATFTSYAPIDVFPYLGRQSGKAAIAAMMKNQHAEYEHLTYQPIFMVVETDVAAVIVMVRLKQRSTGRIIQLVNAHFLRLRNGRIVELREFMDTFDAVQQVLGRELAIGGP
jgi:ketosteroid isomerase-like protein